MDNVSQILLTCLLWVFAVIGGGWTAWALYTLRQAFASRRWPRVTGKIISSTIVSSPGEDGDTTYRAVVKYDYTVNRIAYQGSRVYFGARFEANWREYPERIVAQYRPGHSVDVYYDPDEPNEASLECGPRWQTYANVVVGLLFVVISMVIYFRQ
ncbi:MAG: DUF3592 domain-containing protein [bacterium]